MSRVHVLISARNALRTLPDTLRSIEAPEGVVVSVCVVDNGSTDGMRRFVADTYPRVMLLRNVRDLGVASGWNQGARHIVEHTPEGDRHQTYVLFLGADVVLAEGSLARLARYLDENPSVGAVGPKLLKMFEENVLDEAFRERVESDHLASVGLLLDGNLEGVHRGEGNVDAGQYDNDRSVFALDHGCALVRVSALASACVSDLYLLPELEANHAFTDLCWRLWHAGFAIHVAPQANAYAYHGVFGVETARRTSRAKTFYNQRTVWMRNVPGSLFVARGFVGLLKEVGALCVTAITPRGAGCVARLLKELPGRREERKQIRERGSEQAVDWSRVTM